MATSLQWIHAQTPEHFRVVDLIAFTTLFERILVSIELATEIIPHYGVHWVARVLRKLTSQRWLHSIVGVKEPERFRPGYLVSVALFCVTLRMLLRYGLVVLLPALDGRCIHAVLNAHRVLYVLIDEDTRPDVKRFVDDAQGHLVSVLEMVKTYLIWPRCLPHVRREIRAIESTNICEYIISDSPMKKEWEDFKTTVNELITIDRAYFERFLSVCRNPPVCPPVD